MKKYILFAFLLLFTFIAKAQTVLLEEDVNSDTIKKTVGPNLRNYHHLYISYGMMADKSEKGADINYGKSSTLEVGYRYKLRVTNHYAIGTDLWWGLNSFNLIPS